MNLEKSLFKKVRNTIATVAMSSVFLGCPHPTFPHKPEVKPEIAQNVTVLSSDNSQKISSIDANNIYLSQPPTNLSSGKIIVSGITPSTPSGLLRKVIGISADGKTLYTEQASLEEVVSNYSFDSTQELTLSNVRSVSSSKGITPRSLDLFNFSYNIDNVTLLDFDGIESTKDDDILANGNISFNSNFNLKLDIEDFELKNLVFKNITSDKVELTVSSPQKFLDFYASYPLKTYEFNPFVIATIPTVPPIPIIVTPKLKVSLDVVVKSSSLITATLKQSADLTLGVSYSDSSWKPIKEFNNNFDYSLNFPEKVELSFTPKERLTLWLYDRAAGIYGEAKEYASFFSDAGSWQVYAGLIGEVGVDMGIFKKFIPSYSETILQYDKLITSGTTNSGGNGGSLDNKILFVSNRDGNPEIYSVNSDGSNITRITNNSAYDYEPAWSPNKDKIVFVSERDGNPEIYTMNLNGSELKRLTNSSGVDRMPDWSPDGSEIVFYSERNNNLELWLMNSDGANQKRLNIPFGASAYPKWFPDSNQIIFSSSWEGQGNLDIYSVNKDGTNLTRLTTDSASDVEPIVSRDGTKIAFSSNRVHGSYDIWVMDIDGKNQKNLSDTTYSQDDYLPSWFKDGTKIVYNFGNISRSGSRIYIMNSDGTNKTRLLGYDNFNDIQPVWSP